MANNMQSSVEELRAELSRLREASVAERERLTTRLLEAEQRSLDDRLELLSELLATINKRDDNLVQLRRELNQQIARADKAAKERETSVAAAAEFEIAATTARTEADSLRSMLKSLLQVHTQLVNTSGKFAPLKKYRHYQQLLHRLNEVNRDLDGD